MRTCGPEIGFPVVHASKPACCQSRAARRFQEEHGRRRGLGQSGAPGGERMRLASGSDDFGKF
eukprot:15192164-Alexandrium_andersonii.AAC.1